MQQKQLLATLLVLSLLSCHLLETEARLFKFPKLPKPRLPKILSTERVEKIGKWLTKGVANNAIGASVFFGVGAGINEAIEASKKEGDYEEATKQLENVLEKMALKMELLIQKNDNLQQALVTCNLNSFYQNNPQEN